VYQSPIVLVAEADMIKAPIKNASFWLVENKMIKIFNHYISKAQSILLFVEVIILVSSVYLGATIRFVDNHYLSSQKFENFFISACVFALVMVFSMSAFGMYQYDFREDFRKTTLRLMPSLVLGFGIITLVFYLVPDLYFGRGILALVIIITALGILLTRLIFLKTFESRLLKSRVIFFWRRFAGQGMQRSGHECWTQSICCRWFCTDAR
jgi:small-conductance mechanosensitive channel